MVPDSVLAQPPPFDEILSIFVEDDWKHFQHDPNVLTRRCYNFYAGYGAAFRPRSILEVGVRRGYSAFALVRGAAGAVQRFVGLDFQEEGAEMIDSARRLIAGMGVPRVEMLTLDTQLAFPDLAGPFALAHVDADHSTRGALSDLANVLPLIEPGGVIVVDDYDHPPVAAGVQALLAVLGRQARHLQIANYRGHMLIWPGAERPDLAAVFARLPAWAAKLIEIEDLVLAARQIERTDGPFALRARSALSARTLALLVEGLGGPGDGSSGGPSGDLLATGALPGLRELLGRARTIARLAGLGSRAAECRAAVEELEQHIRYCEERAGSDGAVDRALFGEFSLHAVNFVSRIAAPLLSPRGD